MTTDESAAARPLVYAHRGASEAFAEHTRAAYLQAIADGADGVECDIHLTRDQHAVLLHDANLDRTSDGTRPVADRTSTSSGNWTSPPGRASGFRTTMAPGPPSS